MHTDTHTHTAAVARAYLAPETGRTLTRLYCLAFVEGFGPCCPKIANKSYVPTYC